MGRLGIWTFRSLPSSACADVNLAEGAGLLGKMMEQQNQSPPTQVTDLHPHPVLSTHLCLLLPLLLLSLFGQPVELLCAHAQLKVSVFAKRRNGNEEEVQTCLISRVSALKELPSIALMRAK